MQFSPSECSIGTVYSIWGQCYLFKTCELFALQANFPDTQWSSGKYGRYPNDWRKQWQRGGYRKLPHSLGNSKGKPGQQGLQRRHQLCSGQRGPRKDSRSWAPGRSHQDVPTLGTVCMSRFSRLRMEARRLPCLRYRAKFPESQPLKASGLPIRAFISLWYLLRITYQLDSSIPLPDWQFTKKRNISETLSEFSRLLLAWEVSIRMTLSFQLLKLSPVRCSAYTEREQRDIVPSEFS